MADPSEDTRAEIPPTREGGGPREEPEEPYRATQEEHVSGPAVVDLDAEAAATPVFPDDRGIFGSTGSSTT